MMFYSAKGDEILKAAFEMYNEQLCESLPNDSELDAIPFSQKLEEKMQKLLTIQKKAYYYMINTVGKRVAIIALALLITLTATTFGVKAIRETVIDFITETFDMFTKVSTDAENPTQEKVLKTVPQYTLEGYNIINELDLGTYYQVTYGNQENNTIDYIQEIVFGSTLHANTEGIEYETIYIGQFEGMAYIRDGCSIVIFADENYFYTLSGKVPMDELIKMAESIPLN